MLTVVRAPTQGELQALSISLIRKDGGTQHRITVDPLIVAQYAALMREGVEFPPIRVWQDRDSYWLSDGFQRLAAAESACRSEISAEVHRGSLADAQWDSYAANATHGLRRTVAETRRVVQLALLHPNSRQLSNVELAKNLHVPETTLRRWRKTLSLSHDDDGVRLVTRGETSYPLPISNLGKHGTPRKAKSRGELRIQLVEMKKSAPPTIRRLLTIVEHWAFGQATTEDCLEAMNRAVRD